MKKICLQAFIVLITAMVAVSCTKAQSDCDCTDDGKGIPVTFTMSTPAGEAVPYSSATRATHDEAEWTIHRLSLYVYSVDAEGNGTFLRRYATDETGDKAITIVSNGAGTYTFTLNVPVSDMKSRQRFVFVANDAFAEPGASEPQDELQNKLATVALEEGNAADLLAAQGTGIAMSGIAQSSGSDIVTITPGVKCEVHLQRIVARVDVQNNTPNLVINSIELQQTAPKGYLFPHDPVEAADQSYITEAMNTQVNLGTTYAEQTDLKKVFYLYERTNAEGDGAQVKITYTINNSNGEVIVPFRKTSDDKAFINIERNTLYTIILGNGDPITTNPVSFTLKVEDWNAVDMDEAVDPDEDAQAALNAALKVNMFTPYNVKSLDLAQKKVTAFYDKLTVSFEDCPVDSYFTWEELNTAGLTGNTADAYLTDDAGNKYRLPTAGELNLLFPSEATNLQENLGNNHWGVYYPWWNDNLSTNDPSDPDVTSYVLSPKVSTDGWTETIYLKNGSDGYQDQTTNSGETDGDYIVSGKSWMKRGITTESNVAYPEDPGTNKYNFAPVYGLRFQGTSQYAAYRWESCRIGTNPLERFFSVKIKALKKDDVTTTIDQVAQESFWTDGYVEFKFPASGFYAPGSQPVKPQDGVPDNVYYRGMSGRCWASSLASSSTAYRSYLDIALLKLSSFNITLRIPVRLVRVQDAASSIQSNSTIAGWKSQGTVKVPADKLR